MSEMTEQRLLELIAAYGSDPDRWPVEKRAAAIALLKQSFESGQAIRREAALDALLSQDVVTPADTAFRDRIERIPGNTTTGPGSLLRTLWPFGGLWQPAAGLAAAALFGLVTGITVPLEESMVVAEVTESHIDLIAAAGGMIEEAPQ